MCFSLKVYVKTLLVSVDEIGSEMKETLRLKYDAVWV